MYTLSVKLLRIKSYISLGSVIIRIFQVVINIFIILYGLHKLITHRRY